MKCYSVMGVMIPDISKDLFFFSTEDKGTAAL